MKGLHFYSFYRRLRVLLIDMHYPMISGLIVLILACLAPALLAQRPNILLIMSDDQGYGDLGIMGNKQLETPNLDSLFQEGVTFSRFYVSPVCAPTRASLLTGRYHHRTGVSGVFQGEEILSGEEVTIPEILSQAGYVSGCFGKWHNGNHWPETPNAQGFDEFLGFTAGVLYNYFDPELVHNDELVQGQGYITDLLTAHAIKFMLEANARGQPFFCYVPYNVPHTPIQVGDELYTKYQAQGLNDFDAGIYAMLENMDQNIGRLLELLNEQGIADNTIVIFLSDNGPNSNRFNAGLRGRKSSVYDGGVRVPFVIRWPDKFKGGWAVAELAAHIDILPTLAQLCGAPLDPAIELDGVDISPLLFKEEFIHHGRLLYTFPYTRPVGKPLPGSIRNERWTAARPWDSDWQLFDMLEDPGQTMDLAAEHPAILRQFVTAYEQKFAEVTVRGLDAQPIQIGHAQEPIITLKAGNAFLNRSDNRGIEFSYEKFPLPGNWITNWSDQSAYAYWKINNQRTGLYRATLHYSLSQQGEGMDVTLRSPIDETVGQVAIPFSSPDQKISFRLEDEAQKYRVREWATLDLGELALPAGEFELKLASGNIFTPGALEVKALTLTPIDTEK